jgi:soluble lytic murein transglycosylase
MMVVLSSVLLLTLTMQGGEVPVEQQREQFLAAERALASGDDATYRKLADGLRDYPLYGYLRYAYLRGHLQETPDDELLDFFQRYADSPISAQLRSAWLTELAGQERWEMFLDVYRGVHSTELQCQRLRAKLATGRTEGLMQEAETLWLVGHAQPEACDPAFDAWRAAGHMTTQLLWKRIRLAVEEGQWRLVQYLAGFLSPQDQAWTERWRRVDRDPSEELPRLAGEPDSPMAQEILRFGIKRLAHRDAAQAHQLWNAAKPSHSFTAEEAASTDRDIAISAAAQNLPEAMDWLAALPGEAADARVREWRVRCALRKQDWASVLKWLNALSSEQRAQEAWRYWRARALESLGQTAEARSVYAELAETMSYYGFLAADRIGSPYAIRDEPIRIDEQALQRLEAMPGMERARELYFIGKTPEARREWAEALNAMDKKQAELAAVLARRWGWYDSAIAAAARSGRLDDLDIRFPLAYRDQVRACARDAGLDPAWVYGVLRQESAFWADARSSAGALGLMQLMPDTARHIARKLNFNLDSVYRVLEPDINIRLGSAYLKRVLDSFQGHEALATAAYNAGPQRVRKWLPEDRSLSADIWLETLPFGETRSYVRQVMAYTAVYGRRLGMQAVPLKVRMIEVTPAGR